MAKTLLIRIEANHNEDEHGFLRAAVHALERKMHVMGYRDPIVDFVPDFQPFDMYEDPEDE